MILLYFDVKNKFPSVPVREDAYIIKNLLLKNNTDRKIFAEINETLHTCLPENYFEFNEKIYSAKDGLIMGNPLSPLLAEIFMKNKLKNKS